MGTEQKIGELLNSPFGTRKTREIAAKAIRTELETAWLRGWVGRGEWNATSPTEEERDRMAADYAERVVGGSTRPEGPR